MTQSLQRFKADFFKALAHPTRIRILELLQSGEKSVSELQLELAVEGSTVSQQLAILRMKNVVETRKSGNLIYYRLRDPRISELLDVARQLFDAELRELQRLANETANPPPRRLGSRQGGSGALEYIEIQT
jgi:DNA-binding transcriptional ArsR family regulator